MKPVGSGRKRGSRNKRTTDLNDVFERLDFNVPEQIVALLPELPAEKRVDTMLELMNFVYPKRKAVENTVAQDPRSAQEIRDDNMTPEERRAEMNRLIKLINDTDDRDDILPLVGL
jgi:hypothetical protein